MKNIDYFLYTDMMVQARHFYRIRLFQRSDQNNKKVLTFTISGKAVKLLPNGMTAHSQFHIPLDVTPESTCDIK